MGRNSAYRDNKAKRRINRAKTRQIISKLPSPTKKKKVSIRDKRLALIRRKKLKVVTEKTETPSTLKFGSINVDGLDIETEEAIRSILLERKFDVRLLNLE